MYILSKIYLVGECFTCIEDIFETFKDDGAGVSGFTAGHIDNPTYREVCSGFTGHNEVVEVHYNSDVISLKNLLEVFFTAHDPTTLNRQGNDVGTQYRSGIYFTSEEDKEFIENYIREEATKIWEDNIVTEVLAFQKFFPAEGYHQNYFNDNSNQGYCRIVIDPKVSKLKSNFKHLLKDV